MWCVHETLTLQMRLFLSSSPLFLSRLLSLSLSSGRYVEDFRDVFSAKDVEAVIICTPNFHHIEVRMYHGLHDG